MSTQNELSPAMLQYMELKNAYPDYLMFYRMGDFYELFFQDAIVAAEILNIALTKRGKAKGQDIPMCGVPFHAYEAYLAKLIKNGQKVAICEQMLTPEEMKQKGMKGVVPREVVRLVTAGTVTEDSLLDARRNNYLLAISKENKNYGLAWADLSTGEFFCQELHLTEENEAQEIYAVLCRLQPSEILLPDSLLQKTNLFRLYNEYKSKLTPLADARFNGSESARKIKNFYKINSLEVLGALSKAEIVSCGVILDYISETQIGKMPRMEYPHKIFINEFMEIDASTRRNLELLEGNGKMTLLTSIDRTVTGAGARMLAARLTTPLLNIDEINKRLDVTDFFIKHDDLRGKIRIILKECPDIERALGRLSSGHGGPRDLAAILKTLMHLPKIITLLDSYKAVEMAEDKPQAITELQTKIGTHYNLINTLKKALDLEKDALPVYAREGGFIAAGYSPELDNIRDMRDRGHQYIVGLQTKYVENTGIDALKIKYNNVIGYFIEVPNKFAAQLLADPQFVHRQSVLNAARFSTKELTELENEIRSASEKALAIENNIFEQLVCEIISVDAELVQTARVLAALDIGAAIADLALECNYCRPQVDMSFDFVIQNGRHPVVETALRKEKSGVFVGNDCALDGENDRIWLITGPNMAGKSTFLRQNAILAIMAQSGVHVPAQSARIGMINKLFSRVGASDDLAHGRSTFMVEMEETSTILHLADERSFVILDEIGRGTATFDGLSIAWSVVEYIHEVNKCRTLFATHYHEIAVLDKRLSALSLHRVSVKEYNGDVIFLHEVVPGAADRSYGIYVAKLAGMPKAALKRAEQVLQKLENDDRKHNSSNIEQELPLFSFAIKEETPQISALEKAVAELQPDDMTAREALEKLYELKELSKR